MTLPSYLFGDPCEILDRKRAQDKAEKRYKEKERLKKSREHAKQLSVAERGLRRQLVLTIANNGVNPCQQLLKTKIAFLLTSNFNTVAIYNDSDCLLLKNLNFYMILFPVQMFDVKPQDELFPAPFSILLIKPLTSQCVLT